MRRVLQGKEGKGAGVIRGTGYISVIPTSVKSSNISLYILLYIHKIFSKEKGDVLIKFSTLHSDGF